MQLKEQPGGVQQIVELGSVSALCAGGQARQDSSHLGDSMSVLYIPCS